MVYACTDAHDAVELQLGLEARDAFVRMVADNINGMVGYWDKHQRNCFANRHYLAWFGRSQERMQGATLAELMGPELYKLNQPYIERALAGEPRALSANWCGPMAPWAMCWLSTHPMWWTGKWRAFWPRQTSPASRSSAC